MWCNMSMLVEPFHTSRIVAKTKYCHRRETEAVKNVYCCLVFMLRIHVVGQHLKHIVNASFFFQILNQRTSLSALRMFSNFVTLVSLLRFFTAASHVSRCCKDLESVCKAVKTPRPCTFRCSSDDNCF